MSLDQPTLVVIDVELKALEIMGTPDEVKAYLDGTYPVDTIKDCFKIYALGQEYSYAANVDLKPQKLGLTE